MAPSSQDYVELNGRTVWPLDNDLVEGVRHAWWLETSVIKHHRTWDTMLNSLVAAGSDICHVEEWCPAQAHLQDHPEWQVELNRPMFLLMKACRHDRACMSGGIEAVHNHVIVVRAVYWYDQMAVPICNRAVLSGLDFERK